MLRVRLVLWYSLLVVLTVATVGAIQYVLLYRSLTEELDTSLLEDARATLRLVQSRSAKQLARTSVEPHSNFGHNSLKELVDEALSQAPDTLKGDELTDRVLTYLMNEMLIELSGKDSSASDPLDLIVERTLTSRRNNMVEIFSLPFVSDSTSVLFRTKNLGQQSLQKTFSGTFIPLRDSAVKCGSKTMGKDEVRAAFCGSKHFGVMVAYSTNDIDASVSSLLQTYLFLLPVALIIASLGGLLLSKKALRPIEEIAETARDINARNLSNRILMPDRQDKELALLVTTLNTMFERLENSFQRIAQFSSDASHELKTPLAIMRGEIEQMQRKIELTKTLDRAEAEQLLSSMTEEVNRMQRIVEGLLLLAKADDQRLSLELEEFDLSEFLSSIAEDTEILAADKGLEFVSDILAGPVLVRADKTKFYQVLMNLVDNALKYTPAPGTITMYLYRKHNAVVFGVKDTGKGIAPEDQEKIFQRFFRTEEARSHRGAEYVARSLGLGLAIVKSIVEAHGGTITVESALDKGANFIITLPATA